MKKSIRKTILCVSMLFVFVSSLSAQVLPARIKKFLDESYSAGSGGWKQAPGSCDGRRWIVTGDFNRDGRTDYLVRITTGKSAKDKRLHLIGFINQKGDYVPDAFFEDSYTDDLLRSATSIIKRGTNVSLGLGAEGEGPSIDLEADAVTQYICETDASLTYVFKDGEFKDIRAGYADLAGNITATQTPKTDPPQAIQPAPAGQQPVQMSIPEPTPAPMSPPMPATQPTPVASPQQSTPAVPAPPVESTPTNSPAMSASATTPAGTPQDVRQKSINGIPDLTGAYAIFEADEKLSAATGTVTYDGKTIIFKISDGRSMSRATAFVDEGKIFTGWNRTATVSADGKTIFWSNNTKWVRR
jgi:hypothetical protein